MAHISFRAESTGNDAIGEANVVEHPKGSLLTVGNVVVARLSLADSDYLRNARASGLRVSVFIEHIDADGAYGHFAESSQPHETDRPWIGKFILAVVSLGLISWFGGLALIRLGIL